MNLLAAFAALERELIVERTRAGMARARKEGRVGGRPRLVVNRQKVAQLAAAGVAMKTIAEQMGISERSVYRMVARRS
jgi:DNA invertase Pin-like site-specific DNA recombinase